MAYSGCRRERCLNTTTLPTCVLRTLCGIRKPWTSIWPTRTGADQGIRCYTRAYRAIPTATISSPILSKLHDKRDLAAADGSVVGLRDPRGFQVCGQPALDGPHLEGPPIGGASEATQKDATNAEEHPQRYTSTGIFECVSTLTVSLPRTTAETPRRPCEAITIKSHLLAEAASMIA